MLCDIPAYTPLRGSSLRVLDEPSCPLLRAAASELVKRKQVLDDLCGDFTDHWLVPDCLSAEHGFSLDSSGFLSVILPFLDLTACERELHARISIDLTLGESWRWKPNDVNPAERGHLLSLLSHDDRAFSDERDAAAVFWIRPLGLFVARAGRNRVRFLRSMGERTMPAAITPVDYPAANRLTMHRLQAAGRDLAWIVLDGRYLRELSYPALSVPVLRAYGVRNSYEWPFQISPLAVLEEMDRVMPTRSTRTQPIDLLALKERQEAEAKSYAVSLSEITVSKLRVPLVLLSLTLWAGASAGLALLADTPLKAAFNSGLTVLLGAAILYSVPLFRAARRFIELRPYSSW